MKFKTRFNSLLLALAIALTQLSLAIPISAEDGDIPDEDIPDEILFSSSFESGEAEPLESVSDDGYYNNVKSYKNNDLKELDGEITGLIDMTTVRGTEGKSYDTGVSALLDGAVYSAFTTNSAPTEEEPLWVTFALTSPQTIRVYGVTSGSEKGRDPTAWTLYGSSDGVNYVVLDSQSDVSYGERRSHMFEYEIGSPAEYQYYKFEITSGNQDAYISVADLRLGTGIASGDEASGDSPMATVTAPAPASTVNKSGTLDGTRVLAVYGNMSEKTDSYARNVIYSDLDIPVTSNTVLSYIHYPEITNSKIYDYYHTPAYMMIDIKFTDGTYLSELGAVDQNGFGMDPVSKGKSNALYDQQWNYIETRVGDVAAGKVIEDVCVYFRVDEMDAKKRFLAYFDDIVIENKAPVEYEHLSDYIVTTYGTNGTKSYSRGLSTPLTTVPNGFNFFTPLTESSATPPYHYMADRITRFTVSHIASGWIGEYGTWQFMPNTSIDPSVGGSTGRDATGAEYSHDNEIARAHYYSVVFDEGSNASGVKVEITPTAHAAYVRFTFPAESENVNIIAESEWGDSGEFALDGARFTATSEHTLNGSGTMYIVGEFSVAPTSVNGSLISFPDGTAEITMKLATSFISYEQAQHNLELEISADDTFETVFARAQAAWDEICGKVELDGATFTEKTKFYTNLYRVYCYPILYSENAGTNESPEWIYRSPYSGEVTEGKMYTNNGFWDTYRTVYAVYSLLTPSLAGEILDGLLQHYKDSGMIPRWMAPGGTNCMVGTSIEIIFADAYIKGIEFDYETAYEAMLKIASAPVEDLTGGGRPENDTAPFIGYVSNETGNGFSWTVEDFIGDYCIGMMAKALGKTDDAEYYINRALGYVDLYNESAGFFMGKSKTGEWTYGEDFDPINWLGDYTETNAWTMLFTAGVYDGAGLAELLGGKDALAARLDEYFDNSVDTMESLFIASGIHETVEAREVKLGHYQHSNQPSHAVTYLYTYADQPYKTQALTRDVLSRLYVGGEIGQGYLGDEDNGEMAGWYVLSSLGIYPQNMSSGQYIITSPVYDKATLHLDGGDFVIETNGNSMTNVYIQSAELNGEAYSDCFISHSDIADGGTLVLEMGSEPSDWGVDSEPMSVTSGDGAVRPAEDLNDIYPVEDGGSVLTDNTSATAENLADGAAVVIITEGAELDMITVTSGDAEKAPTSFILEASNDGQVWRTLREEKLDFMWDQYVRPYSVPEYLRGVYAQYRITFVGEGQIAEIEFLGRDAEGQELTYIDPAAPDPEPPATEPPVTEPTATDPADTDPSDGGFHAGAAAAIAAAVVIAVMAVILAIKKKK